MKPQEMQTLALAALTAARPSRIPAVTPLGAKVDRLGLIRAQLDQLAREADEIRDELEAAGLQTIARRFEPSPQLIRRHTKRAADSVRMTLTAKPRH